MNDATFILPQHEPNCTKCTLASTRRRIVGSVLPSKARVLFVAQSPGEQEDLQGTPLIGPSGMIFNDALQVAQIPRSVVGLANVCRCMPPNNRDLKTSEIKACTPNLLKEIELLKPQLIVTMGAPALAALGVVGGVGKWRGRLIESETLKTTILPTWHPAAILNNKQKAGQYRAEFFEDIRKVVSFVRGEATVIKPTDVQYVVVDTYADFEKMITYLKACPLITVDTETKSDDYFDKSSLLCISFSGQSNTGMVLPFYKHIDNSTPNNSLIPVFTKDEEEKIWVQLRELLNDPNRKKVLQNYSYDLQYFKTHGASMNDPDDIEDTMLMDHIYSPEKPHDLKTMAFQYTDMGEYDAGLDDERNRIAKVLKMKKTAVSFDYVPDSILWKYSAADADATMRVYYYLLPKMIAENMYEVYRTVAMPTRWVLNDVERGGVSVDSEYGNGELTTSYKQRILDKLTALRVHDEVKKFCAWQRQVKQMKRLEEWNKSPYRQKRMTATEYMNQEPEFEFNPYSHLQLSALILEQMKLPIVKRSRQTNNPSFDDDAIQEYAKKYPFMAMLSEYRSLGTFFSTYVVGALSRVSLDGKLRTDYLVHGTATGRLSSRDPNLHNLPRDAHDIQHMYTSDPECLWGAWDAKQAEFRVWCNFSQDPQMLRDINAGHDIHKLVAALGSGVTIPMGDITPEQFKELTKHVTKRMRQIAKDVVFGIMFGRGAASVAEQLEITTAEAQHIIDVFFGRYQAARDWILNNIQITHQRGHSLTFFGRRRFYPDINSKTNWVREEAERQCTNSPIQGTATDIVNAIAAVRIKKRIDPLKATGVLHEKTRQILTIHDALYYNMYFKDVPIVTKIVFEEMTRPIPGFNVRLDAEMKLGESWDTAVALSDEEVAEIIACNTQLVV